MTDEEKQAEREKIAAEERAKISADLAAKDDELRKLREKDTNFEKVRKQVEEAEAAKAEAEKKLQEKEQKEYESIRDSAIKARAGADEKLQESLLEKFNEYGKDAKTQEEIDKAMDDAYVIVTGKRYEPDATRRVISAAGGRRFVPRGQGNGQGEIASEVRDAIAVFNEKGNAGITEDDLKLIQKAAIKRANATKE